MLTPLQITFKNLPASAALEALVAKKAAKLERFAKEITRCHVTLEAPNHRHCQGTLYHVHILLNVPGKEIVVNRHPPLHQAHSDIYVAIRDAFNAATRQLQDVMREQHHQVKHHELSAR